MSIRKPRPATMSLDSQEMSIKGFAGIGTVARALKEFWKRWTPGFVPDVSMYKETIAIAQRHFGVQGK